MSRIWTLVLAASSGVAIAAPVSASESPTAADISIMDVAPLVPGTVVLPDVQLLPIAAEGDFETVSDSDLSDLRGGEALVVSNQTLTAITTGNVINGGYTAGNVSLSDHALSSFNGVGNLLINTGAQASLQTGMNLTINVGE